MDLRRLCPPPTVSASRLRETLGTPRLSGRFGAVYSASTAHLHLGSGGNGGRPRPSHVLDGLGWFRRKVPFRGGAVAALFVSPVHPPTGDRVVTKEPNDFNPVTTVTTVTSLFYIPGLRHDPKFGRVYDTKVVGYAIAKGVPLGRDFVTQEAKDSLAEAPVCRVALVVGDGLVHRAP